MIGVQIKVIRVETGVCYSCQWSVYYYEGAVLYTFNPIKWWLTVVVVIIK